MPPIGTPSPFRLPSQRPRSASARSNAAARGAGLAFRSPASSSAGRQFASTPRFVLPGSTPSQFSRDEIDSSDHEEASSPVTRPARRETGSDIVSAGQKDVIEDSEEEEFNLPTSSLRYAAPDSHIGERDIVAEFDELFPPTPHRVKRRRVSDDPEIFSAHHHTQSHRDPIQSSPSEPPSPSETRHASPPRNILSKRTAPFATPAPQRSVTATTETPRPGSSNVARTPFRIPPRYTFSASQSVSHPSPHIRFGSSTPAPQSPPRRRKPAFILPRSPSPSLPNEDPSIPTPFSPSSRSLRRGRPRSNTPSYLPGGMAAQVRSWILETAATREHNQWTKPSSAQDHDHIASEYEKYLLAALVIDSSQGTLSSGSFTLVKGHSLDLETGLPQPSQSRSLGDRNLLLLGPPQSKALPTGPGHAPRLDENTVIGVHHGLAWEVELGSESMTARIEEYKRHPSPFSSRPSEEQSKEKWLVGLEWDLIR